MDFVDTLITQGGLAQLTTSDEITLVAYIEDVSTPTVHADWTFLCGYLVSLT